MRILIYSHSLLPRVGGVEVFTDRLARYLAGEGDEVGVVTRTDGGRGDGETGRGREGEAPAEPRKTHHSSLITHHSSLSTPGCTVWRRPSFATLRRLVADSDLVHMNGFSLPVFLAARMARRPLLWFHHDYDTICPKSIGWDGAESCGFSLGRCYSCLARDHAVGARWRRIAGLALRRMCLRLGGEHAAHNRYVLERLALGKGLVLPCAAEVRPERRRAGACPPPPAVPEGPGGRAQGPALHDGGGPPLPLGEGRGEGSARGRPFGLFAGRLIREKGCDVAIRALAECRRDGVDMDLVVCGDGPERETLVRLASELGVGERVCFGGFVAGGELAQRMRASAFVVVPSLWDEPTGAVALEAMACGRTVVAADVGGLGELVRGFGVVFPRGDHRALAARIGELIRSPGTREELERRSRDALAAGLDWGSTVQLYRARYRAMGGEA